MQSATLELELEPPGSVHARVEQPEREHLECCICFERFERSAGIACDSLDAPHFACDLCFVGAMRIDLESEETFPASDCSKPCFGYRCRGSSGFSRTQIEAHLSPQEYARYDTTAQAIKYFVEKFSPQAEVAKSPRSIAEAVTPESTRKAVRQAAAPTREDVETWTVEDVCGWLESLELPPAVVAAFRQKQVDSEELLDPDLSCDELLDKLGIEKLSHRKKVHAAMQTIPCLADTDWRSLLQSTGPERHCALQAVLDSWKPHRWVIDTVELGRGSSGAVFGCTDSHRGLVAIKFVHSEEPHKLKREAALMERAAHERVCRIFEGPHVSSDGKLWGLVLELLDHGNLESRIKNGADGRVREFEMMQIGFDILEALKYMHGKGVVHLDIKPANIMLTKVDGKVIGKLVDFSVSAMDEQSRAAASDTLRGKTTTTQRSNLVVGTPHYMSPEQFTEGTVTAQSDLWSLGVVFFEALSGVRPFAPAETDVFKIGMAVRSQDPLEMADIIEEVGVVTEPMEAFVTRALQRDLSKRFQSAAMMSTALEAIARAKPGERFGMFISYRVWCDKIFAESLYKAASKCQLRSGRENRLKVYLDKMQMVDGQRFDVNFARGLANSQVFVPLVSANCLKNFVELGQTDKEDFVLTEWVMALELQQRGYVQAVFPIVVGEQRQDGTFSGSFFEELRNGRVSWPASEGFHGAGSGEIPDVVSHESIAKAKEFLAKLDPPLQLTEELTVRAVVQKLLQFQAMLVHFENGSIDSMDGMKLVRVNSTHGTRAKDMAWKHVTQTCAERVVKLVHAQSSNREPSPEPEPVSSDEDEDEHAPTSAGGDSPSRRLRFKTARGGSLEGDAADVSTMAAAAAVVDPKFVSLRSEIRSVRDEALDLAVALSLQDEGTHLQDGTAQAAEPEPESTLAAFDPDDARLALARHLSATLPQDFLRKKAEMTEKIAQKKEAAAAKAAAATAKSYTVEPEGAYLVHPSGNLMSGQLYMSDKNLTFKSTIDGGMINAKVPLSDILAVMPPTNYALPSNAPMYVSICGGQVMSSFRVIFSTKKTKAQQLAEMKKDSSESSTEVDYIVPTERAGALYAALMPYVGKEKINRRKGKMGRLAEKMAYAGMPAKPEKAAGEPDPTPFMIAGGAPPSDQTRVPPPGWKIRESQQYPGKQFYWHEATDKSSWTYPGGCTAAASASPPS